MRTVSLGLILASVLPAQAKLRLLPIADATTSADQPTTNYGSGAELSFGMDYNSSPPSRVWFTRGLSQFDLSSIPRPPLRATFWWNQTRALAPGCRDVALHRVTQPWSEATVTWNTNPPFDPIAVTKKCVGDSSSPGWKSFDMTLLVRGWMTGAFPNFGFVIRDDGEVSAGAARPGYGSSREGADPLKWPYLELEWFTTFDAGCIPSVSTLTLSSGEPSLGKTMTLGAAGLPASAPVYFQIGLSNTSWMGVPLPYIFTTLAPYTCKLLVSADVTLTVNTDPTGGLQVPLPLPNLPALRGQTFYHQVAGSDQQQRVYFTNGVSEVLY